MSSPDLSHVANERLAFSFLQTVPSRATARQQTFANTPFSEPRDWGYTGLLLFTAILLIRPHESFPALAPLRLADVFAILGIAPMLLHRMTRRMPVFRMTAETTALVLFGATMLVTAPFSIWPGGAISMFTETFLKIIIVFVLMLNTLTSTKRIQQLTSLILLSCGYIAARGVLDYARGVNLQDGRLGGAVGGIFGNPNDLALNMVAILPIAVVAALSRRHALPWRAIAAFLALLMVAVVIFTKSRGGLIGLVLVVLAMMVMLKQARPLIAIGTLAGTLVAAPFLPADFYERMATIANPEVDEQRFTGSSSARTALLREGVNAFMSAPLTGVGAGQFINWNPPGRQEPSRQTHNAVLQVAADLGVAGVIAYCFLIFCAIRTAFMIRNWLGPQPRKQPTNYAIRVLTDDERTMLHEHSIALSIAFVGWFACAMFAPVAYSWTFYYLLALTVAARELIRDRIAQTAAAEPAGTSSPRRHGVRRIAEPVSP